MDDKVKKVKRERSKNYNEEEKESLLSIVEEYLNIIENKKTDSVSAQEKKKTWDTIAIKYYSLAKTGERTGQQLKLLFESQKKLAKKHKADDKVEVYKTGSGSFVPTTTNTDNKIIGMLQPQFNSLQNPYDSNIIEDKEIHIDIDIASDTESHKTALDTSDISSINNLISETKKRKTFFKGNPLKKKPKYEKEDFNLQILEMKKERHLKKMEILEIIKKKELIELKLKEKELNSKDY